MADENDKHKDKEQQPESQGHGKRSTRFLWVFGAVAVVVIIGVLLYYFLYAQYHVSTKDAYVNGNLIRLQPQVSGTVNFIGFDQTQPVRQGQTLVELDPHDADISLGQAKANLAETVRDVVQLFAEEQRQQAVLQSQQAQLQLSNTLLGGGWWNAPKEISAS
jgi:membrane fusion protein, multidrug efflux system